MQRFSLILFFTLITTGCAVTNIKSANIDNSEPLPNNHGVIIMQLANNASRLSQYHNQWDTVRVIRVDNLEQVRQRAIKSAIEKARYKDKRIKVNPDEVEWQPDTYLLNPVYKGTVDTQVFIGSVPEGIYSVESLKSTYNDGNIIAWISMPVLKTSGKFKVKSKQLTNLGSLVFQPLSNINTSTFWRREHKAYVTRVPVKQDVRSIITSNYPNIAKKLILDNVLTWDEDALDPIRMKLATLSKQYAYTGYALPLNGELVGGLSGRLGQFKLLDEEGIWKSFSFPTNSQVYTAIDDGKKLAFAGEYGKVFVENTESIGWVTISPVKATEAIIWINKGDEYYYAMTLVNQDFNFYKFTNIDSKWHHIGSKKVESSFFVKSGGIFPIITKNGQLRVFQNSIYEDYDSTSNKWRKAEGIKLLKLAQDRTGVLLGVEVSQWDGVGDQVISYDDGESWHVLSRNLKWNGDYITDKSLPASLTDGTVITLGRKPKPKNVKSDEHDDTLKLMSLPKQKLLQLDKIDESVWEYHSNALNNCENLLPQLTHNKKLYFLCQNGEIVSTEDLGKTWITEQKIDFSSMLSEYLQLLRDPI